MNFNFALKHTQTLKFIKIVVMSLVMSFDEFETNIDFKILKVS